MAAAWFIIDRSSGNARDPGIGTYKIEGPVTRGSALYATYEADVRAGTGQGPYDSRAAAQTALAKLGGSHGTHSTTPAVTARGGSIGSLIPGWSVLQSVKGLIAEISDPAMWRSLGWLALGIGLLMSGLIEWILQTRTARGIERTAIRAASDGVLGAPRTPRAITREQNGHRIRTPLGSAPVVPVIEILIGAYLAWFAIHYWRDQTTIWPTDPVKDALRGLGIPRPLRAPSAATEVGTAAAAAGTSPASIAGQFGGAGGQEIAKAAAKYNGKVRYVWGGASPATGWDCSGMVNYVLAHDCGLDIPGIKGGTFTGRQHGPDVAEWLAWSGVEHVGTAQAARPGDLVAWGPNEHIGIVLHGTTMISAEDPAQGTREASFNGFFHVPPIVLRLRAVAAMGTVRGNQQIAALIAGRYGWSPSQNPGQWHALVQLWQKESGWSVTSTNAGSGAYGIPQALPGDKMAAAGKNWRHSAQTQIRWGLKYIRDVYGSPEAAWQHELAHGWY